MAEPLTGLVVPVDPQRPPIDVEEVRLVACRLDVEVRVLGLAPLGDDGRRTRERLRPAVRLLGLDPAAVDVIGTYEPASALAAWMEAVPGSVPVLPRRGTLLDHVPVAVVARSLAWWSDVPVVRRGGRAAGHVAALVQRGPGDEAAAVLAGRLASGLGRRLELLALDDGELDLPWLTRLVGHLPTDVHADLLPLAPDEVPHPVLSAASWVVSSASDTARRLAFRVRQPAANPSVRPVRPVGA